MAVSSLSNHLWVSTIFFFLFFKSIDALSNSSFSLSGFGKDPNFELNIALFGDAKIVGDGDGDALQLTGSEISSAGRVMYKKPIKLIRGKNKRLISFSTDFSFSLLPNNSDGFGFLIVPNGLNISGFSLGSKKQKLNVLVVKFKTFLDDKNGTLIMTRLRIDAGDNMGLADSINDSNSNWAFIKGQKLHGWIDYEVGSRRLEVRLAQNGDLKPSTPLLSYPIDLSQIWEEDQELIVGLTSSNGNSSQTCLVYSWSFKIKSIPKWMHSEPLDPKTMAIVKKSEPPSVEGDNNCFMRVVAAMIFGTACGALTAFIGLYIWTIFGNRRPVVPEELATQQKKMDVKYEKVVVVLDKAVEDGKKVNGLS